MALEQFRLDGQVAIVTGAGKGVGAGIARVLAEAGATVVGTARTEADIVGTIAGIEAAGGEGLPLVADAMSRSDGERVVHTANGAVCSNRHTRKKCRWLNLIAEFSGHHRRGFPAHVRLVCDLCLHHESARRAAHAECRTRFHHQHLLGSARFGIRALTAYCVAKGGLEALTRAMAQELAPKIRVNAIALGSFATDGLKGSLDLMPGSLEKTRVHLAHRLGDVEDLGSSRCTCRRGTAMRRMRPSTSTAASTRTTRRCQYPIINPVRRAKKS